jgi:hypothetical protein
MSDILNFKPSSCLILSMTSSNSSPLSSAKVIRRPIPACEWLQRFDGTEAESVNFGWIGLIDDVLAENGDASL